MGRKKLWHKEKDGKAMCNIKDMIAEKLRLTRKTKEVTCGRCKRIMNKTDDKY